MPITVTTTTDSAEDLKAGIAPNGTKPEAAETENTDIDTQAQVAESRANDADDDADDDAADSSAKPAHRPKARERINRLTWEKYQLQSEADKLRAELDQLRRQPQGQAEQAQVQQAPKFADPKPKLDNFDTVEAWTEAMSDWTERKVLFNLDQRDSTQRMSIEQQRFDAQQRELQSAHLGRIEQFRPLVPDFDETAQRAITDNLPFTPTMQIHATHSDVGPALMYELAKNPDECRRIAALPQGPALVALGEFQARIRTKYPQRAAATPASTTRPEFRRPPAPIKPVGGGQTTTNKPIDEMSQAEYNEMRRRQGGR